MATAEQIKSLIRLHFNDNFERFYTVALQVAAHEAKQGHIALAHDIRNIIDTERKKQSSKIIPFPTELQNLVMTTESHVARASLVISEHLNKRIERIIHEYRQKSKLKAHGLQHRRKVLLIGPPGVGKTMTAQVLAHELRLPLYTIQVDRLVTKYMGETSAKLRQIFELIQQKHGVYLFDEFDAIGSERSLDNDVGEMRRVLNAFLQFIEQDRSDSLIIAATNHPQILDKALYRRFDDVFYYELPQTEERKHLIANVLGLFQSKTFAWTKVLDKSQGLSHSDITQVCLDAIKNAILMNKKKISAPDVLNTIKERHRLPQEDGES